ncbi:hypothetical protein MNBD_BACTEROID06-309 [hydrothermal vent metagenome]|uniref:Calx-beta domain-containing protein n=1 Tax=hydrothermal vent metagenome TaxID=652676 RepID=A0A3B0USV7_9ZZZZ
MKKIIFRIFLLLLLVPTLLFFITLSSCGSGGAEEPLIKIGFDSTSSTGSESVLNAEVQVNLSASTTKNVTVDYEITGTATNSGTDFTLADGTLTIMAGATSGNITITDIIDDAMVEGDETVIITLLNPTNATLGANTEHTYTITDNDSAPSIEFNSTSSNGLESVLSVDVQVNLSASTGENVTVDYEVTGTATNSGGDSASDFTLANGTLTIWQAPLQAILPLPT